MKLRKLYIASITLLASALVSCSNDTETFDNQVYINASAKTTSVLLKSTAPTAEGKFKVAIPQPESKDITISLKAEPALVATYNAAYYDHAEALPAQYYALEKQQVSILAGSTVSDEVAVKFKDLTQLDREKIYVLPVTIEQANIGILESARTMYYVLKGAALINVVANITKNLVYVNWSKPEVADNLKQLTAEALIRVNKFDKMLTTIMGIEGGFLIRIGDAGIPNNQLQVATTAGNVTSSDLVIPTGEWTHIAVTYDADAGKIIVYINGKNKLEADKNCGAINWAKTKTDEGNGFWIGHSYNRERFLEGEITECRIWNKVLTQDDINAKDHFYEVVPGTEGLVSYWKFDEGAGTAITDYSGNGNNATAVEAITWNAVELPAKN
ncbi:DUF1735 and LamG domain-containing protein [Bacteroides sp.]|uniref:DUF1735 and LamG domain-containing protein n=1 Tax=Bacteroides sp. TaxID=29523 RepID=UPI00263639A4|nr:DUF1735 and LamG domain-containing protein [Bacteroides sp.]